MGYQNFFAMEPGICSLAWRAMCRARDVLVDGHAWRVGAGEISFWFNIWSVLGLLGALVLFVHVSDLDLRVRDVCA